MARVISRRPAFPSTEVPRKVTEVREPGPHPLYHHPEWRSRFPWVLQATTGRGDDQDQFDLGSFGVSPIGQVLDRWKAVRDAFGARTVVHARQVHGTRIGQWDSPLPMGLCLTEGLDGHVTARSGVLLVVSVADCVPVSILAEEPRTVAMVHAGWRGVAGGALEAAVRTLEERAVQPSGLWVHFGPSICGECYEVGPEVHAGVHPERPPPGHPTPIDLRAALAERAASLGIRDDRISISTHCTLCGPGDFFSHRGGDAGRQMGLIGLRE